MPRCKCCKDKFVVKYFNQKYCMIKDECIKAFVDAKKLEQAKEIEKKKKKFKSDAAKEKKVWYEKNGSYAKRLGAVKSIFQKFIRLRDKDEPCISCGIKETDLWDGGHYLKAELYSGLIFHEMNCNKQCRKCNFYKDGNELEYREGLINKIGEQNVLMLENSKDYNRTYTYSNEELAQIKAKYSLKIKELSK